MICVESYALDLLPTQDASHQQDDITCLGVGIPKETFVCHPHPGWEVALSDTLLCSNRIGISQNHESFWWFFGSEYVPNFCLDLRDDVRRFQSFVFMGVRAEVGFRKGNTHKTPLSQL